MARPLRIQFESAIYHISSRGNERKSIFFDDSDRECFLDILSRVIQRYHWLSYAYCLMRNHYHLVVETPDGNLAQGMRQLNGIYTQKFNRRHRRAGHLFQGRYKAVLVQKESYLMEVCRYVVLNPVRAKITSNPAKWKWSSYSATAGSQKAPSCLAIDAVLGLFGTNALEARKKYRSFIYQGIADPLAQNQLLSQTILGSQRFVDQFSHLLKELRNVKEIPKLQRFLDRPPLHSLFGTQTFSEKRKRNRQICRSIERYGYSQKEVADFLGLHYSTVSRLINEGRPNNQD